MSGVEVFGDFLLAIRELRYLRTIASSEGNPDKNIRSIEDLGKYDAEEKTISGQRRFKWNDVSDSVSNAEVIIDTMQGIIIGYVSIPLNNLNSCKWKAILPMSTMQGEEKTLFAAKIKVDKYLFREV